MAFDILHATYGKVILEGGSRQTFPSSLQSCCWFAMVVVGQLTLASGRRQYCTGFLIRILLVVYWCLLYSQKNGILSQKNPKQPGFLSLIETFVRALRGFRGITYPYLGYVTSHEGIFWKMGLGSYFTLEAGWWTIWCVEDGSTGAWIRAFDWKESKWSCWKMPESYCRRMS